MCVLGVVLYIKYSNFKMPSEVENLPFERISTYFICIKRRTNALNRKTVFRIVVYTEKRT